MRRLLLVLVLAAGCSAPPPSPPPGVSDEALLGARQLTALTQNLYIGIDLAELLQPMSLQDFEKKVAALFESLGPDGTNLPARAGAIAHEIALRAPDLVGVEEAALWTKNGVVAYDFLGLLVDDLCHVEHVCYAPVVVQVNADVQVPGLFDDTLALVGLADRDAILLRDGSRVEVQRTAEGHYKAELSVPTPLGDLAVPRGWVAVDARIDGVPFRFLDTHLEAFAAPIRDQQAVELLLGPTVVARPVVASGDFNFDPSTFAYGLTRAFGFADAWHTVHPHQPGFTCCQAADLRNLPSQLDQRIDYVFSRGGFRATEAARVGARVADRVDGLWPSDHAGVATALRVPWLPFDPSSEPVAATP